MTQNNKSTKTINRKDLKRNKKKNYTREDIEKETLKSERNDVSWYASSDQLLNDSCSLSFNNPLGTALHLEDYVRPGQRSDQTNFKPDCGLTLTSLAIPGVCCLEYVPVLGYSTDNLSPVNIAATNTYSFTVHANSRNYKYSRGHQMMYLVSMDSVYTFFAWMSRVYGIVRSYDQKNFYLPQGLMKSMNVNFDDIVKNLANLRTYINSFVLRASKYAVPANMSLYLRHMWMVSGIWKDSPSSKSQIYLFNPRGLYYYNATYSSSTSALQLKELGNQSNLLTYDEITAYGDVLLNALDEQEDIGIMSGDILKAYGSDGIFKINMIPEDFTVTPMYSAEVLSQIQNATMVGSIEPTNFDGLIITEDNTESGLGAVIQTPEFKGSISDPKASAMCPLIINSYSESPTPSEIMVATRLKCSGNTIVNVEGSSPTYSTIIDTCGTEIITTANIYVYKESSGFILTCQCTTATTAATMLASCYYLSMFDCHPGFLLCNGSGTTESPFTFEYFIMDFDNYTLLDFRTLKKMHLTALLSEFAVPNIALGYKG